MPTNQGFDQVPETLAGLGVKTGTGLIENDHRWVANEGNGDRQLSLFATRQYLGNGVRLMGQLQGPHKTLRFHLRLLRR